jgi:hypothetical protein
MPHKSRIAAFVIDSRTDAATAAEFWSKALRRKVQPVEDPADTYRSLEATADEPMLLIQQVTHDPRIHLDIESDDLEAEVKRLEELGAKRVEFVKRWWVMEAPTGQRFCVVNPQRGPLP